MFQKPFRVKTQTAIKGSDRKKLRASIGSSFPTLTADDLTQIVPAKEEMTVTKIYTYSGDTGIIYSVAKNPVVLELDRQLYPTVYTLWRFPQMVFTLTTWPQLHKKFLGGADLMLPGVIVQGEITPSTFKQIRKGDTCAVKLNGNLAPVAVGKMALSGSDMFDSGMRGKGVQFVHILGDELWAFGDKSQPPLIPDVDAVKDINIDAEGGAGKDCSPGDGDVAGKDSAPGAGTDSTPGDGSSDETSQTYPATETRDEVGETEEHMRSVCIEDNVDKSTLPDNQGNRSESVRSDYCGNGAESAPSGNHGDSTEVTAGVPDVSMSVDEVDTMLDKCFKCAVKASVKKSDLPILTSAFYRQHILSYCPAGKSLDIKKSSYKKLSKFLKQKEKEGYIVVKELNKGVDSIVSIDKSHQGLKELTPSDLECSQSEATDKGGRDGAESFRTPTITEMFSIPSALVHLVKPYGYSKGSTLTVREMRNVITDYVRDNNLQDENDNRNIQLDPHLADIVLNRGEGNTLYMTWEDVISKVLSKAQPAFSVTYPGKPAVISKGKIEPIKITVEQRASNKKATLIDNLEMFGIDPADVAHRVQVGVACSTSVNSHPQKGKGMQVLMQGNQVKFVADLLLEKYKVPRKYVTGLEKMPKNKKK
ncbi:eukaryotic translation initiation factor 2D-like [Ylistrum balloti]|uniref:eukaryotic translation initiation factor 2D-like n=1 Tax=Ylistrum balloti TaxID=509963 RepID=UPI0029058543|nr:eukaryotic translation initiation factor 2D-like [Ylistrum balloti]